jgi:hypothetical protein
MNWDWKRHHSQIWMIMKQAMKIVGERMNFLKKQKHNKVAIISIILIFLICCSAGCANKNTVQVLASPSQTVTQSPVGEKANALSYVYTTKRSFAITFSGRSDKNTIETILNELDKYNMKGLFFLQAMRVAEEPDIAKEILNRGSSIGNEGLKAQTLQN